MAIIYANNFSTTLGAALTAAATSMQVKTGDGTQFPTVASPDFAFLTLVEGTKIEIVKVTAHASGSDTFTIARGADSIGTTAGAGQAFTTAAVVECRVTAGALNNFMEQDSVETISGVKTFSADPIIGTSLKLASQTSNPAPVAGMARIYSRMTAGRQIPKWIGPTGVDYFMQESLWGNGITMYSPGSATLVNAIGDTPTATGTYTRATPAAGSYANEIDRQIIPTAATASTGVGLLGGSARHARIAAAGHGGFFMFFRFTINAVGLNTSFRCFLGLTSLNAIPTTDPSAVAGSIIGIGCDAADTTLSIMRKDGTTAQKIAITGSSKVAGNAYDCMIFCPPGNGAAGNIFYRVDDLNTGATLIEDSTTGVSTNAPLASTMMRPMVMVGTATAVVQSIGLNRAYYMSDY